jgi:hypothetical protein
MSLIWKLLRQHISVAQFAGFFFANLFGMIIVLLGFQFYRDVLPVFTQGDSFMKEDYLIISKKISTTGSLTGRTNTFNDAELSEVKQQEFTKRAARFTSSEYKVNASMGINGVEALRTEMFFESVPDGFVDVNLRDWHFAPGSHEVPIILPRSYINMYNFGFAQSRSLPKISDGLVGMIDFAIFIHGNGHDDEFKGRVIGFSSRLNTILVPQSFMDWSNQQYAPGKISDPTRLVVEVHNPADDNIAKFFQKKSYETEDDKLDAGKTTWFLRIIVSIVMIIGLVISLLSFYILMLSIYLLVQKNSSKLENLLLIGYSPNAVARPYQLLTVGLNVIVLLIALIVVFSARGYYMDLITTLFPDIDSVSILPMIGLGLTLFLLVSVMNIAAIRRKVINIWHRKE